MSESAPGLAPPVPYQGEQRVNDRAGNSRPRGGRREREKRERATKRAARQQEGGDIRNGDTEGAGAEGQPAAGGGSGRIGRGGGDGRRGDRQSGNGGGRPAGRGGPSRLDWRPAVDEQTGELLSREAVWDVASQAAATPVPPRNEGAEDASTSVDAGNQQGQGNGEALEDGLKFQIARDRKTGQVLAVRQVWMSSSIRSKPRPQNQANTNPSGGDGVAGAPTNASGGAGGGGEQGGEDAAAIQRIMERLDL